MGWILSERGAGLRCNRSVVKKTGSMCSCRRLSLWTLAMTLLTWHSNCHTSQPVFWEPLMTTHNWLLSEPPIFEDTQQTSNQVKKMHFTIIVVTFLGGWASGPHFIFFWDNVNNQKYAWIILLRMTFFGFDVETRQSYAGGILLSERVRSIHLQRDRLSDRICRLVDQAYSWRNYGKLGWLE